MTVQEKAKSMMEKLKHAVAIDVEDYVNPDDLTIESVSDSDQ